MSRVDIAVTGERLVGQGVRSIEGVLEELVQGARKSLHIAVYTIAPSAVSFLKSLKSPLQRGVMVYLLVNNLQDLSPEVQNVLLDLQRDFPGRFETGEFQPATGRVLHAKVIVADRQKALVGSANLSWSGLTSNIEIGMVAEGETAWILASLIDRLRAMVKRKGP